jgi:hypothetical protein
LPKTNENRHFYDEFYARKSSRIYSIQVKVLVCSNKDEFFCLWGTFYGSKTPGNLAKVGISGLKRLGKG